MDLLSGAVANVVEWADNHPYATAHILMPLASAAFVAVFKKRSDEEYIASASRSPQWLFSRWTAFIKLAGGLGVDPYKVLEAIGEIIRGKRGQQ